MHGKTIVRARAGGVNDNRGQGGGAGPVFSVLRQKLLLQEAFELRALRFGEHLLHP